MSGEIDANCYAGVNGVHVSGGGSVRSGDDDSPSALRYRGVTDFMSKTVRDGALCVLDVFRGEQRVGVLVVDSSLVRDHTCHESIVGYGGGEILP